LREGRQVSTDIIDAINSLHAQVVYGADAADEARQDVAEARQALRDAEQRATRDIGDWAARVIRLGELLEEHRADYGRGWRRDYEQHGLHMAMTTAYRYIACASQPGYQWCASVEEWARYAARAIEPTPVPGQRRRSGDMTLEEVQREAEAISQGEYIATLQRDETSESRARRRAERDARIAALPPDEHWRRLHGMLSSHPSWLAVIAALRTGWRPPECVGDTLRAEAPAHTARTETSR